MDIDIKDTITLCDDNSYVVAGKTTYQENVYYYLIDRDNNANIKFCVENKVNSSLLELEDSKVIRILLPLFLESATNAITKEEIELLESMAE